MEQRFYPSAKKRVTIVRTLLEALFGENHEQAENVWV